jgi:hypothetical protein
MKKISFVFFLMLIFCQVQAQVFVPATNIASPQQRHCCCCDCGCDSVKVQYKPINHWSDVKHIIYIGVNPTNATHLHLITSNIEQGRTLMNLMSNTPSLYFGHEHIIGNAFIGGDIGGMFGGAYQKISPELNMQMNSVANVDLNLGYHLMTTQHLRLYLMGKFQFSYASVRLQKQLSDIPQKSWNRFISNQNQLLPYDRLVEGFLTTDRWGDEINIHSSFFTTQLRVGMDYRVGKVKFGFHTGYTFQLSDKIRNWRYSYEFEEGDERRHFQVTDVPLSFSLDGLNFGMSIGYLFSDTIRN